MKRVFFFLLFGISLGYAFVGPSLGEDWGIAGVWYRLRTYTMDWTNGQRVFEQFRFSTWMVLPSWGSLPIESFFLWAGPYVRAEVFYNGLFTYDGAIGVVSWGLFGFDGNFSDRDNDGRVSDDTFWGTSLAIGPAFRYTFFEGCTGRIFYIPVYHMYAKAEKTEIFLPENHWAHNVTVTLEYLYDEYLKGGVWVSYAIEGREREYRWGYEGKEVFPQFDQGGAIKSLVKIPIESFHSFVKCGVGIFWREKAALMFGVSPDIYEESGVREVRGYHQEEILGRVGAIGQFSYGWQVAKWLQLEGGIDGLFYQFEEGRWGWKGGIGGGLRFQWNTSQALMIEYNHPFLSTFNGGQIVVGFVWLFAEEGV